MIETMTKLPIGVTRVDTEGGTTDYITCIPMERVFAGGLTSEAIVGVLLRPLQDGERIQIENFAANRVFVDLMQAVISSRGPFVPQLIATAKELRNGPLYVIDQRTKTPDTEVPETDVFGEFDVKNGEIVPGSYRPNTNHYLLSADGFFRLGAELEQCLMQALAAIPDPDGDDDSFEVDNPTSRLN